MTATLAPESGTLSSGMKQIEAVAMTAEEWKSQRQHQPRPRLTVQANFYYERPDGPNHSVPVAFQRFLSTSEQPYVRERVIGGDWEPMDCGWIVNPGFVIIENLEGHQELHKQFQETSPEGDTVFIGTRACGAMLRVLPGEAQPLSVVEKIWHLRASSSGAKIRITVYPD